MSDFEAVKVTVSDPVSGEVLGEKVIENDYMIVTAGNRVLDGVTTYGNGTHVATIKVVDALRLDPRSGDKCQEIGHDKRGSDGICARCLLPLPKATA